MLGDASLHDEAIFTTVAVCPACPPGRTGFHVEKLKDDWDVAVWHVEPCPQRDRAPRSLRMPGCEVCHTWDDADFEVGTAVLPGFWAFHVKHGRTPLTSQDGTLRTAAGGDYCPVMEVDKARVERVAEQAKRAAGD